MRHGIIAAICGLTAWLSLFAPLLADTLDWLPPRPVMQVRYDMKPEVADAWSLDDLIVAASNREPQAEYDLAVLLLDPFRPGDMLKASLRLTIRAMDAGVAEASELYGYFPPALLTTDVIVPMLVGEIRGGNEMARYVLADRLERSGEARFRGQIIRHYQAAAGTGIVEAQYALGRLYEEGNIVAEDLEQARLWYRRAANQGHVKSIRRLAHILVGERETPVADLQEAWSWSLLAAADDTVADYYDGRMRSFRRRLTAEFIAAAAATAAGFEPVAEWVPRGERPIAGSDAGAP